MAPVTQRLERQVRADFGSAADAVLTLLVRVPEELPGGQSQNAERMQAALVLDTAGDVHAVASRVVTAAADWRDLLVGTGLANGDWPATLDVALGQSRPRWPRRRPRRSD